MDSEVSVIKPDSRKPSLARAANRQAIALLRRQGNIPFMIVTLLFALVVTFSWLTLFGLVETAVAFFQGDEIAYHVFFVTELLIGLFRWLIFFALVVPAWLGRWRVAGLVALGKRPPLFEAFHYFTSWQRYFRAVQIGLQFVFCTLLPMAIGVGAFVLSFLLYRDVFDIEFDAPFAVLLLVLCLLFSLLLTALMLVITCGWATVTAVAIGNESLSWHEVWHIACGCGRQRFGAILGFRLRVILLLLLSVLTLGIAFVAYYAHHTILSYMRLSMALCPKGDPQ